MKTSYDPEVDALSVSFVDRPVFDSEEVSPGLVIDYDADNRIVGFEVLNASSKMAPGALPSAA